MSEIENIRCGYTVQLGNMKEEFFNEFLDQVPLDCQGDANEKLNQMMKIYHKRELVRILCKEVNLDS